MFCRRIANIILVLKIFSPDTLQNRLHCFYPGVILRKILNTCSVVLITSVKYASILILLRTLPVHISLSIASSETCTNLTLCSLSCSILVPATGINAMPVLICATFLRLSRTVIPNLLLFGREINFFSIS